MADTKTTAETAADALADADIVRIVQGGANKKATFAQVKAHSVTAAAIITALNSAVSTFLAWLLSFLGCPRVIAIPFAFDTPNLLTGATVYTPTIGDILMDAWIEVDTAWDGTTPTGDIGTIEAGASGLFGFNSATVDMHSAETDQGGFLLNAGELGQSLVEISGPPTQSYRVAPIKFIATNPLKVWVSQNGQNTGDDPGSTHGSAILYLVIARPVAL